MNASPAATAKVFRTEIYPAMFYGIECSDISERQLAAATAPVIDVFKQANDNHDVDWFFSTFEHGADLDPVVQIIRRRVMELRRATAKRPET